MFVILNRKEGYDQESIQLPNTFRLRHQRERRTHLKQRHHNQNTTCRKPGGQFLFPKNAQTDIKKRKKKKQNKNQQKINNNKKSNKQKQKNKKTNNNNKKTPKTTKQQQQQNKTTTKKKKKKKKTEKNNKKTTTTKNKKKTKTKQEVHGPRFAYLSDIATADMQMLCNIFPILSSQLMKISSFEQFLVLKKNIWA